MGEADEAADRAGGVELDIGECDSAGTEDEVAAGTSCSSSSWKRMNSFFESSPEYRGIHLVREILALLELMHGGLAEGGVVRGKVGEGERGRDALREVVVELAREETVFLEFVPAARHSACRLTCLLSARTSCGTHRTTQRCRRPRGSSLEFPRARSIPAAQRARGMASFLRNVVSVQLREQSLHHKNAMD